jgi:hypothetical protein
MYPSTVWLGVDGQLPSLPFYLGRVPIALLGIYIGNAIKGMYDRCKITTHRCMNNVQWVLGVSLTTPSCQLGPMIFLYSNLGSAPHVDRIHLSQPSSWRMLTHRLIMSMDRFKVHQDLIPLLFPFASGLRSEAFYNICHSCYFATPYSLILIPLLHSPSSAPLITSPLRRNICL